MHALGPQLEVPFSKLTCIVALRKTQEVPHDVFNQTWLHLNVADIYTKAVNNLTLSVQCREREGVDGYVVQDTQRYLIG